MLKVFKAVYFWIMAIVTTAVLFTGVMLCRNIDLVFMKGQGRLIHNICCLWGRCLIYFMPGWKVSIEGNEHLPPSNEAVVIVANHESMSDIWAICFLKMQFRWLSKASIFKMPMIGQSMTWAGYVPILRGHKDSHLMALQQSAERLRQNISMFFFPEGTRSIDGEVKAFKLGAFRLAKDEQKRVLPVAIHGASMLLPKGSPYPGRSRIRIKILPLEPAPSPSEDLDQYAERIRQKIITAHKEIKR